MEVSVAINQIVFGSESYALVRMADGSIATFWRPRQTPTGTGGGYFSSARYDDSAVVEQLVSPEVEVAMAIVHEIQAHVSGDDFQQLLEGIGEPSPWAQPGRRSEDYPGLVVHDGRVTGSITFTDSRLPVWAIIPDLVDSGFDAVLANYDHIEQQYAWSRERLSEFLTSLLDHRGEIARLLCVLADVERRDQEAVETDAQARAWWHDDAQRQRVTAALRAALDVLER